MQKRFYIVNYGKIMNNFARGSGEYSLGLLKFTTCSEINRDNILKSVKQEFSKLIHVSGDESFDLIRSLVVKECDRG